MSAPASRSQGSKSHPCAHFVRFTEAENKRLHALVKKRRRKGFYITIQAFAHAAVMRAIKEAEIGKETAVEAEQRAAVGSDEDVSNGGVSEPQGLGIRERLRESSERDRERRERSEEVTSAPPSSGSVYTPPSTVLAASADVTTLARTIVNLPLSARREALAAAVQSLAHGRAQDEALHLADQLDEEIKRLDAAPTTVLDRVRARLRR